MTDGYVVRHGRRIAVTTVNADSALPRKKRKPFESQFVKLPRHWITGLQRSNSVNTYRLAHMILREGFKREHVGGKVVLSTKVTSGMIRSTKIRAARELVELGLIRIEQDGNRALIVTIY
jgi:hypothetical protein